MRNSIAIKPDGIILGYKVPDLSGRSSPVRRRRKQGGIPVAILFSRDELEDFRALAHCVGANLNCVMRIAMRQYKRHLADEIGIEPYHARKLTREERLAIAEQYKQARRWAVNPESN